MKTPKMILFDYGHTLAYEPKFDALRGEEALFAYVTKNPNGITPQQANAFAVRIFGEAEEARKVGFEVAEHPMLRLKMNIWVWSIRLASHRPKPSFGRPLLRGSLCPGLRKC